MKTYAFAALSADKPLVPFSFERRESRANDVVIEILYCGVCHSDLHTARNDWGWTNFPIVVGHEIVGHVLSIGPDVTRHKVGDHVAVGTMVDSCQHCDQCHKGEEQLCREGNTQTFAGADRITGEPTMGGYAKHIVVREEFVLSVPAGLDLAKTGPLLCAGATTYSPLRTWNVGPGSRVGVIGMGGLGHMAIKLAEAMGARVTVLSRSPSKAQDAKALGADAFLVSSDKVAMEQAASSFDLIIDTVPAKHELDPYLPLLDIDGTLCIVGQIGPLAEMSSIPLLLGRRRVAGSAIAGIEQTQEMLEFCASNNVLPEVEMIRMDQINEAYDRLERSDVRYRFVIDMGTLEQPQAGNALN
ncbi:alcohol dehydrogenase catalytic domain-containing protein [Pectobacterium versatile]|nr:alcohol dehydrogenase catalytic domain-containing protein [Pectobacterium versatile]